MIIFRYRHALLTLVAPSLLLILFPPSANPQTRPAPSADRPDRIRIQGSIRTRAEAWNWFGDAPGSEYVYSGNLLRLGVSQQLRLLDWNIEFAAPILLGLPDDAVQPAPQGALGLGGIYYSANDARRNAAMAFPKQAFVRFKNLFGDSTQSLRVGRFEFFDGGEITPTNSTLAVIKRDRIAHRLVGTFIWTHAGRSYDGAHYIANRKGFNVTLMGALPTRGVFQTDGWGNLDTAVVYGALSGQYNRQRAAADWRVFGIYYHDWRNVLKNDNRALAVRRADTEDIKLGTFGGHYLSALETSAGGLDFVLWGALQTGRWGNLTHRAFSYDVEAGFQPRGIPALRPWIRAGYSRGSGDDNPNDNRQGTFHQLLPTPRPFARFPFHNMMNNADAFVSFAVRPTPRFTVRTEVHSLALAQRRDLWYQGGGAFQPWSFGYIARPSNGETSLATLYDVSADWNITPQYTLSGYLGYADAKRVIQAIYPRDPNGRLAYLEFNYRF
jgi:hypothetical protein